MRKGKGLAVPLAVAGLALLLLLLGGQGRKAPEGTEADAPPASVAESAPPAAAAQSPAQTALPVARDGTYHTRDEVALYIRLYRSLPSNFITKAEARALGWEGGGLKRFAPGKSIGGDRFGNYEGLLPEAQGRVYYECDIVLPEADSRGGERIVFSNDGLIYHTRDHYRSFTQLCGDGEP